MGSEFLGQNRSQTTLPRLFSRFCRFHTMKNAERSDVQIARHRNRGDEEGGASSSASGVFGVLDSMEVQLCGSTALLSFSAAASRHHRPQERNRFFHISVKSKPQKCNRSRDCVEWQSAVRSRDP